MGAAFPPSPAAFAVMASPAAAENALGVSNDRGEGGGRSRRGSEHGSAAKRSSDGRSRHSSDNGRASGTHEKRKLSRSQSTPEVQALPKIDKFEPQQITRLVQCRRSPAGGFVSDAPSWEAYHPAINPSRHRDLSRLLWSSTTSQYLDFPEVSEYRSEHADPGQKGAQVRAFMNPRDKTTLYNEEKFKVGNKMIM